MTSKFFASSLQRALSTLAFGGALSTLACDVVEAPANPGQPTDAAQIRGPRPYDLDPSQLAEEGHKLFASKCSSCHGPDAEGRTGMGPRLASESFLEAATDEMLRTTITKGRKGTTMVAWESSLSHQDLTAIVAYLRSTVPHTPAQLDDSPLQGDAAKGEQLFRTVCARCHGRNGGGYMESAVGTGIGREAFLASVSDGYLRHVIKHGKSQTAMRGFEGDDPIALANFSPSDIDDIIAFLRSNAW